MSIRFDDRVAIVTGAGAGLGRCHALLLAERGARVVVNDPGGTVAGRGSRHAVADMVVSEVKAKGGEAMANHDSVADRQGAARIIMAAMDTWGRLDILVNNAGILRDKAFHNMPLDDFEEVVQVHLMGTVYRTNAAWPTMRQRNYGRIVVTSGSGTAGNFGQANYGAAKTGVVRLINVLRLEGAKYNILSNAISPSADTRMTEGLLPPDMVSYMKPQLASPAVAWLCSEECGVSGAIIAAGGFARVQYFVTEGVQFDPQAEVTPEMVADAFPAIDDMATARLYVGLLSNVEQKLRKMGRIRWQEPCDST